MQVPLSQQDWLDEHIPGLVEVYQDLHRTPELSFQEEKTSAKMARVLEDCGFDVLTGLGGFGVAGVLRNGPGPQVMVRADMDGLPVKEQTGLPYASKQTAVELDGQT
ncbi:MAG: amidohydrolase, partial [Planctomycetes bacterium]|nr:amidohydrolase [Planctomycetota bacterium]